MPALLLSSSNSRLRVDAASEQQQPLLEPLFPCALQQWGLCSLSSFAKSCRFVLLVVVLASRVLNSFMLAIASRVLFVYESACMIASFHEVLMEPQPLARSPVWLVVGWWRWWLIVPTKPFILLGEASSYLHVQTQEGENGSERCRRNDEVEMAERCDET